MLTPKQFQFAQEYMVDHNATQAAVRAGYSEDTAYSIGSENLRKPEIAEEVERLEQSIAQRVGLEAERVLRGIMRVTEAAEAVGNFNASLRGYELLGKHLKLFTDKTEVSSIGGPFSVTVDRAIYGIEVDL